MDNDDFIKSIENAKIQIIEKTADNMRKACLAIETEAKQNCPVDMGVLRASITSETEVTTDAIIGRIGTNEEYAPYVHQGTGIHAKEGNGRQTPWRYTVRAGKYKGFHWTWGQKPNQFLENAKIKKRKTVEQMLGES